MVCKSVQDIDEPHESIGEVVPCAQYVLVKFSDFFVGGGNDGTDVCPRNNCTGQFFYAHGLQVPLVFDTCLVELGRCFHFLFTHVE